MLIELKDDDLRMVDNVDEAMFNSVISIEEQRAMAMQLATRVISKVTVKRIAQKAAKEAGVEMECLR